LGWEKWWLGLCSIFEAASARRSMLRANPLGLLLLLWVPLLWYGVKSAGTLGE